MKEIVIMEKILILLASILLCGCCTETPQAQKGENEKYVDNRRYAIFPVEIEDHIYIVYAGMDGGDIIHAEHCPCKTLCL